MARSRYIYVVLHEHVSINGLPAIAGTFTVKHELITWLKRLTRTALAGLAVFRCQDGIWQNKPPAKLAMDDLVPPARELDKPCEGFRWIGQPFSSCDRCGLPFWEHTHESRATKIFGEFDLIPIPADHAEAVRQKWGRG